MRPFYHILIFLICMACGNESKQFIDPGSETSDMGEVLPDAPELLGEALFHDTRLSADGRISCASCHIPQFAFCDTAQFSTGVFGRKGKRNSPAITNMSDRILFFYDGRADNLEDQIHFPIEDTLEMAMKIEDVVEVLRSDIRYQQWFKKIFDESVSKENMVTAIATFVRTLETFDSKFDDYANNLVTYTASEERGRQIFNDPASKCFDCHSGPDFTNDEFRNIGLYDDVTRTDRGRYNVTGDSTNLGAFKVPGLRNVGVTAPYMHDGSFKTLREVLEYYNDPYDFVKDPVNMDSLLLEPLNLSDQDLTDLENFLLTLTDKRFLKKGNK